MPMADTPLTTELPIEGMTCAACAARIGRGLTGLEGVEDANVNYATRLLYASDAADEEGRGEH